MSPTALRFDVAIYMPLAAAHYGDPAQWVEGRSSKRCCWHEPSRPAA
jgi:hypothetical protein